MPGVPGMRKRTIPRAETRARIWQAMRVMRQFAVPDLIATAEASLANVRKYVRGLTNAGILRVARAKKNGFKGGHQVWALARDLGPHAPRLQRDGTIWDPNSHTVINGGIKQS